jgi:hypothetical protein
VEYLVCRRALDAIDDEHFHWRAPGIELETELLLKRGEEARGIGVDRRQRRRSWRRRW